MKNKRFFDFCRNVADQIDDANGRGLRMVIEDIETVAKCFDSMTLQSMVYASAANCAQLLIDRKNLTLNLTK